MLDNFLLPFSTFSTDAGLHKVQLVSKIQWYHCIYIVECGTHQNLPNHDLPRHRRNQVMVTVANLYHDLKIGERDSNKGYCKASNWIGI